MSMTREEDVVIEDIRSMPTLTPPNEWVSVEEMEMLEGME